MHLRKIISMLMVVFLLMAMVPVSALAEGEGDGAEIPVPAKPSRITAKFIGVDTIQLDWVADPTNVEKFLITVTDEEDSSNSTEMEYGPATFSVTLEDTEFFEEGKTFIFRIYAVNSAGESDCAKTTLYIPSPKPQAPKNLTARDLGHGQVLLRWTDVATNEEKYNVTAWSVVSDVTKVGELAADSWGCTIEDKAFFSCGGKFIFTITASNSYGESNPVDVELVMEPAILAPSEPKIFAISQTTVKLTWVDNATNEDNYYLKVIDETTNTAAPEIKLPANTSGYELTNLVMGHTYQITVYCKYKDTSSGIAAFNKINMSSEYKADDVIITDILKIDYSSASDWALPEIKKAEAYGLLSEKVTGEFKQTITREEFSSLAVKLYAALSKKQVEVAGANPFKDTTDMDVLKAYNLGIIKGTANDTFAPKNSVTRQEMCLMIQRTIQKAKSDMKIDSSGVGAFADEQSIAPWALDSVRFASKNGIVKGTGGNNISPLLSTSREQGVVMIMRAYEAFAKK